MAESELMRKCKEARARACGSSTTTEESSISTKHQRLFSGFQKKALLNNSK